MNSNSPLFTIQAMDALLDKLGEVLRQRDAAIRLGLAATPDAFAELISMREEITRQKHNTTKTNNPPIATTPQP
jgi:hypothetical protein